MERQFELIDLQATPTLPAYASVAGVQPVLHGTPAADWNDDDINRIKVWHQTTLEDAEVRYVGQEFLNNITQNNISVRTAARGLKLAMSIKSMDPGNKGYLLTQHPRGAAENNGTPAAVNMPAITEFGETPFTITAAQTPTVSVVPPAAEAADIHAYTFIAAYLMKLLVKDHETVVREIDIMKTRFEAFYGPARIISRFHMTLQQAAAYKKALTSQDKIQNTYTLALAYTQNTEAGNHSSSEAEMLSYLGYLPFSYTGMHAYTLMVDLKNYTNVDLGILLTLFETNVNARALEKIVTIVNAYERTVTHPERSTYFRYSALWGAHYFAQLRSSQCPHLIYTAACAWKVLNSAHENADPERIAATNKLSEEMKSTLKVAGEIIGESLKASMLGGAGVSSQAVKRGACWL